MSRVAKQPVDIPQGVELSIEGQVIEAKGKNGSISHNAHPLVKVVQEGNQILFSPVTQEAGGWAMAGMTRAVVDNLLVGVSTGFSKTLELVGVGYRAQVQGKKLNLTLGYSHPIELTIPGNLEVETPTQTQIIIKGADKQKVGQFAADVRSLREPEPYKGKGVRYSDEVVIRKQAKKA